MSTSKKSKYQQSRLINVEAEKLLGCVLPRAIVEPHGKILVKHPDICDCCAPRVVAEAQLLLKSFGYENLIEFVSSNDFGGVE